MYSIRKWMFRPKKTDSSALARFFYADEELNLVAAELDSFDGRKDPERCTALVNQLRHCQDKVLTQIEKIMQEVIPGSRASRDFRVKFPDDVLQESLAGQLWFGAECLAAGSSIMNRELESTSMRPLARTMTRHLDLLRSLLRDQCLRDLNPYTDKIREALVLFDKLFAEFELSYVSAMVPVKSVKEYDILQDVTVLFCETVQRAMHLGLLTDEMIDDCDPALMFTIPRLAIIAGLLVYPEGPLNPDMDPLSMSEMFRPFQTLLYKIRELLWTLSKEELWLLEKSLCTNEMCSVESSITSIEEELSRSPSDSDGLSKIVSSIDSINLQTTGDSGVNALAPAGVAGQFLEAEGATGAMSHSPSTTTIVASSSEEAELCLKQNIPAEAVDSVDSSNSRNKSNRRRESAPGTSMASNQHSLTPWQVESRRLRHARSWPPSSTSLTTRQQSQTNSTVGNSCLDGRLTMITSLDMISDETSVEEENLSRNAHRFTHSAGSQEFVFHLPRNTGAVSGTSECETVTSNTTSPPHVIYTTSDINAFNLDSQEIAFVTEAFNQAFVTDLSFHDNNVPANDASSHSSLEDSRINHSSFSLNHEDCSTKHEVCSSGQAERSSYPVDCSSDNSCDNTPNPPDCSDNQTAGCSHQISCCQNPTLISDDKLHNIDDDADMISCSSSCSSHHSTPGVTTLESCASNSSSIYEEKSNSEPSEKEMLKINNPQHNTPQSNSVMDVQPKTSECLKATELCKGKLYDSTVPGDKKNNNVHMARSHDGVKVSVVNTGHSPGVSCVGYDWDRESYASSETSSYTSDCHDDEEISLAIQAAELAARKEARARFKNSSDLIHRLFVCVSGVADQLQTNYAGDLRHILKVVFDCCTSQSEVPSPEPAEEALPTDDDLPDSPAHTGVEEESMEGLNGHVPHLREEGASVSRQQSASANPATNGAGAPEWLPDDQSPHCMLCLVPFTFVRRRHHCRNCGKIFCSRCSANSVPLPHYGHSKPVRVCNHCFMFQVTPFTVQD